MPNSPPLIKSDYRFTSLSGLPFTPTVDTIKNYLKYPTPTNNPDYIAFNDYIEQKTPEELMMFYHQAKFKNIGAVRHDIKKAMRNLNSELGLETDSRLKSSGEGSLSHLVDDELSLSSLRVEPPTSGRHGGRKSKKHKGSKKRRRKSIKKSRRKPRKLNKRKSIRKKSRKRKRRTRKY